MLLFYLIVTLFVNEPQNPFLFTVSVNMSLKMYSFYAKVKFLWELSASQSQPHALGVIAVLKKEKKSLKNRLLVCSVKVFWIC